MKVGSCPDLMISKKENDAFGEKKNVLIIVKRLGAFDNYLMYKLLNKKIWVN